MNIDLQLDTSDGTLAEFARIGWKLDLVGIKQIIAWADDIILKTDEPPYWVIEMAEATPRSVDDVLRRVPGQPHIASVCVLLGALMWRQWVSTQIDWRSVRRVADDIAYRVFDDNELPDGLEMQFKCLSDELEDSDLYDLVTMKRLLPENPEATVASRLQPFEPFEKHLPWWV